jgi:hypothetical protein
MNGDDRIVCFGIFEADRKRAEVRRSGIRIKLQELPFHDSENPVICGGHVNREHCASSV